MHFILLPTSGKTVPTRHEKTTARHVLFPSPVKAAASPPPLPMTHVQTGAVPLREVRPTKSRSVAPASTAWSVLKQALSEETTSGKFNDFREGAGSAALKKLDSDTLIELMRELAESSDSTVRGRAVATLADIDNVGSNRILKRALNDEALPVRLEAAAILGSRGDRSVIEVYRRSLASVGRDDHFAVLTSMKRIGQNWMVSLIRPFLKDSDPFIRVSAAEGLARLGDEPAFTFLRRAMRSASKYLRSSAYAAIGESGGKRGLVLLAQALNDRDPAIRLYAAVYLANHANPSGLHVLQSTLSSQNPALRFTAVEAISQLHDQVALQALVRALDDKDVEVRVRAATALFEHKRGNGVNVLKEALRDNRAGVRLKAVEGARMGCPGPGVELLVFALRDPSRQVRVAAADALIKRAEVRDREPLRQALDDTDSYVRVAAAIVLMRLRDAAAPPALQQFVREGAPERDDILRMMERLKVAEMAPYLKTVAMSGPVSERRRAIQALGEQNTGPAAEALCSIAKSDCDERLCLAAVQALGQIPGDLTTYLLKSLLKDEVSSTVQIEAASILGDRGVETAGPLLRQAVGSSANVRAAKALCKIGDAWGAPVYQQMLSSSDLAERIEAAIVLYRLQKRAPLGVE